MHPLMGDQSSLRVHAETKEPFSKKLGLLQKLSVTQRLLDRVKVSGKAVKASLMLVELHTEEKSAGVTLDVVIRVERGAEITDSLLGTDINTVLPQLTSCLL